LIAPDNSEKENLENKLNPKVENNIHIEDKVQSDQRGTLE
jgi:hypothetical protein